MLMRGSAQGYNRVFTELVKEVKENPGGAPEIIEGQLARMEGASRFWPRDADLMPVLCQNRAYGTGAIARERLLDVLWEVERTQLRTVKHERLQRPEKLQIEHVMPQKWSKNWPLPADGSVTEAERDAAINLLGNLTLVTDRLNPSMSNAAWGTKRSALTQYSLLAMNQQLVDSNPDDFDESSIAQRGKQLARHILTTWPGPPANAEP
jgi:hypothetical protein